MGTISPLRLLGIRVLVWARHLASLESSAHALSDTFQSILRFSCGFFLQTGFQAQSCAVQNSTETGGERLGLCQLSVPGSATTGCMVRSLVLLLKRSSRWPLFPTSPEFIIWGGLTISPPSFQIPGCLQPACEHGSPEVGI